jgi:hypothetical protein
MRKRKSNYIRENIETATTLLERFYSGPQLIMMFCYCINKQLVKFFNYVTLFHFLPYSDLRYLKKRCH